jgi:hypothetical protein
MALLCLLPAVAVASGVVVEDVRSSLDVYHKALRAVVEYGELAVMRMMIQENPWVVNETVCAGNNGGGGAAARLEPRPLRGLSRSRDLRLRYPPPPHTHTTPPLPPTTIPLLGLRAAGRYVVGYHNSGKKR